MAKKFMVHHNDVDKALRNVKKFMQQEYRVRNKAEYFEKPSDTKRKIRITLQRKFSRMAKISSGK